MKNCNNKVTSSTEIEPLCYRQRLADLSGTAERILMLADQIGSKLFGDGEKPIAEQEPPSVNGRSCKGIYDVTHELLKQACSILERIDVDLD